MKFKITKKEEHLTLAEKLSSCRIIIFVFTELVCDRMNQVLMTSLSTKILPKS